MLKKIFLLWDNHTTAFVRVLLVCMIPATIWEIFRMPFCFALFLLWLIVKTGYEKNWSDTE